MLALKRANLLTTVNKGVSDAEQEPADRSLAERMTVVIRRAVNAAERLHNDADILLN